MPVKARTNEESGLIELIDENGNVLTQKVKKKPKKRYETVKIRATKWALYPNIRSKILDGVVAGKTIKSIAKEIEVPSEQVYRWLYAHEDFRRDYENAKKVAAYRYEEEIREIAETAATQDDVDIGKFKVDVYKTLAKYGNQERYAGNPAVHQQPTTPVRIVFKTGITRDASAIDVESQEIKQIPDGSDSSIPEDQSE